MEEQEQGKRRNRLVLVPCPFQGHLNPMLQLGTILHSRGFSITVAHTKFNSPNPKNHPDFSFLLISDDSDDQEFSLGNLLAFILLLNANCKEPFEERLAQLMKQQKPNQEIISCIIYDELMYFSEAAANQQKLPSMILRSASPTAFVSRDAPPQFLAEDNSSLRGLGSQDLVPGFHPLRLKDLPFSKFGSLETMSQLTNNLRSIRNSSAIIFNTIEFLEQSSLDKIRQQYQVPIFPIGPMYKFAPASCSSLIEEDNSCITWLDKQSESSVLYVSLGSITPIDERELAEMAWGLANSKQPFLWVVRPGSVRGSDWIESLPDGFKETTGERGCIVKWAPQRQVLSHGAVGGFWSHCGWNSTLESISEGVPMICRPNSGDQSVNARYISHVWRVGLELENVLEKREVERKVRRLMVDEEGLDIRQRAKELKEQIELSTQKGGSSYDSLNEIVELIKSFDYS